MAEVAPTGLRDRAAIEAARDLATTCLDSGLDDVRESNMFKGAIAAYDWLVGKTAATLSGEAEPTIWSVMREEDLADAAIYARPAAPEVPRHWAIGYQHALMWARRATEEPPR